MPQLIMKARAALALLVTTALVSGCCCAGRKSATVGCAPTTEPCQTACVNPWSYDQPVTNGSPLVPRDVAPTPPSEFDETPLESEIPEPPGGHVEELPASPRG